VSINRRRIIASILAIPLIGCDSDMSNAPELGEAEVVAQTYGYVADAARANVNQFRNFKPGQNCANCRLASGAKDAPWLGCSLFPGRKVAALGWCAGWVAA
jgi:High potential iron-sulfur protein